MPNKTLNYGLTKPTSLENYNVEDQNGNMDLIDMGLAIYLGTTSGSDNAYTIESDKIMALNAGLGICIKFNVASTAASTLNINSLGAKPIKKPNGNDALNLKTGIYTLRYDGTNFILQGEGASGDATAPDLLLGKKATTDAGEITGSMPNIGPDIADTVELNMNNQEYLIPQGRHSGLRKIKAIISNLAANVIKAGATVGGISGTFTSDATASAANILTGNSAYVNGTKIDGTMPNIGPDTADTITLSSNNQEYVIPAGKHSGLRKVKAVISGLAAGVIKAGSTVGGIIGTFTADATAVAAQMLAGVTAYVNGNKITGTIPSKAAQIYIPGTTNQIIAPGQYISEAQTIIGDADLISPNILETANIFNVQGSAVARGYQSGMVSMANGGLSLVFANQSGTPVSAQYVEVAGLTFKPSVIVIEGSYEYSGLRYYRSIAFDSGIGHEKTIICTLRDASGNILDYKEYWTDSNDAYISSSAFRLPISQGGLTYSWKAYK